MSEALPTITLPIPDFRSIILNSFSNLMIDMELRKAKSSDKNKVLEFCKTTFSWGDYISDVWDDWILEGNLLVLTETDVPNVLSKNQNLLLKIIIVKFHKC